MKELLSNIKIVVPENIYSKDPESSELGKKILKNSIDLILDIGFEDFTFKKLGAKIGSNESSIYRYFDNKHKLLVYLSCWYWAWLEYQLVIETHSIASSKEKLNVALRVLTRTVKEDSRNTHINEAALSKIMINENFKCFLTKEVDKENKEGYFESYKRLVNRLALIIESVNPQYQYPKSFASTIIETGLYQNFLKDHFMGITDCNGTLSPTDFLTDLVDKTLK